MSELQVFNLMSDPGMNAVRGARPIVNRKTGQVHIITPRGLKVNSALRKDEWESLDARVVRAAVQRLNGVQHLRDLGLTKDEGSIGTLLSQWNTVSEMTAPDVNMSGRTAVGKDRQDFNLTGVPLPVIAKAYDIGARELAASRNNGAALDTSHAEASARVVAEKQEDILFNGYSSINFQGFTIYGYTTHPNRNTDTATNYGGGDWGTVGNPEKTVAGMIGAANGDRFFGPFYVYAATTQYNQASNLFNTDGSGDTGADRIRRLAGVAGFFPGDFLADGVVILVQMTADVVDWAFVPGFELVNLEWTSGDGMTDMFKVLTVSVPRIKADYGGRSGVVHATGA